MYKWGKVEVYKVCLGCLLFGIWEGYEGTNVFTTDEVKLKFVKYVYVVCYLAN